MNDNKFHATITVKFQFGEINGHQINDQNDLKSFIKMVDALSMRLEPIAQLTDDWVDTFAANYAEPEIEEAPAEPAPENQPHCIDVLSDKITDAMESKALGVNTNQMLKTKAINIVETELRSHSAAAILKRSTRDWIRVDQVGEKAAMFIRSALFDLRKQNR